MSAISISLQTYSHKEIVNSETGASPAFIDVQGLHINFPLHLDQSRSFRLSLANMFRPGRVQRRQYKAALSNINLKIQAGDRVALIGPNGSGKTTLLRALNGVYPPVQGKIIRKGSTAALINATLGMDHYLSGRENIYLRGYFFGKTRAQMDRHVDGIIEFSELEDDIERPIRTYSSGMMARLAFAIATTVRADIYLLDEWIGAGDARFFDRAQERVTQMFQEKSILVLASHSDALVRKWCNKAFVLCKGHPFAYTDIEEGIKIKNALMKDNLPRIPS